MNEERKKRGHHEKWNTTLELIIRSLGYSNIHRQHGVKAGDLHNVTDDEYILIIMAAVYYPLHSLDREGGEE